MTDTSSMKCSECGEALDEDIYGGAKELPCPKCGSLKKTVSLFFEEELNLDIKDSLRGKVKDTTRPSKAKLRQDFFIGDDLHRKSGKWYKKERYLDKDKDTYKEVVTDPETGEVVHYCEEPLSEHQGHGSAKVKAKNIVEVEDASSPESSEDKS